jgi:thioredoxin 1
MENDSTFDAPFSITLNFKVFKKEVLDDKEIVLVAFMADWSGPSHLLDQILEKLDNNVRQKTQILKLDASANKELAKALNISKFPSLVFFKKGEITEVISGLVSQKDITSRLTKLLHD